MYSNNRKNDKFYNAMTEDEILEDLKAHWKEAVRSYRSGEYVYVCLKEGYPQKFGIHNASAKIGKSTEETQQNLASAIFERQNRYSQNSGTPQPNALSPAPA
ncbi:MAG: hypothetical protein H6861_09625 [Rhodospirillales bacterium]|nr:hypothetical protein [Rhodospirillales bacterium]